MNTDRKYRALHIKMSQKVKECQVTYSDGRENVSFNMQESKIMLLAMGLD